MKPANGVSMKPIPRPDGRLDVETEQPEVKSVGIMQHPKTKAWAAFVLVTQGDRVVRAEALDAHQNVEFARLDAKELLLAALYG